jgi:hypothetical protein
MNEKLGEITEQSHAYPTHPSLISPIPPANSASIPPIDSRNAANSLQEEKHTTTSPLPEDKFTKNDKVMIWLTAVIAFGTLVSAVAIGLQWREMVGGGKQTDQIITAANADAATNFTRSAEGINTGIHDAVEKLNLQANNLNDNVKQAARLALATEIANRNAVDGDRPWMGGYITVSNFAVGSEPSFTIVFTNSGKRPARLILVANRENGYASFPVDPDHAYIFEDTPSTSIVVPGQGSLSPVLFGSPLTKQQMDELDSGKSIFFAFAKVEYQDIRTGAKYWTHLCMRYIPRMKTDTDNGFRSCTQYNDAD